MINFGKFLGNEAYINSVVDDLVERHARLKSSALDDNNAVIKKVLEERYRVIGMDSVRKDVLRREIMDDLIDDYINKGEYINIETLIKVVIAHEKLGVAIESRTPDLVRARLNTRKKD